MGVFLKAGKLSYVFVFGGRTENDEIIKTCERYSFEESNSFMKCRQVDEHRWFEHAQIHGLRNDLQQQNLCVRRLRKWRQTDEKNWKV